MLRELKSFVGSFFSGWVEAASTITLILAFLGGILAPQFPELPAILQMPGVYLTVAVASVLVASFHNYRKMAKQVGVYFEIGRLESVSLGGNDFIQFRPDTVSLKPELQADVTVLVHLTNSGRHESVRLVVAELNPNLLSNDTALSDLEITLTHPTNHLTVDNPVRLNTDEMKDLRLIAKIPFSTARVEQELGSVSALREISLTLAAERPGRKAIRRTLDCDLTSLYENLDGQLASKLQHMSDRPYLSGEEVLGVLEILDGTQ